MNFTPYSPPRGPVHPPAPPPYESQHRAPPPTALPPHSRTRSRAPCTPFSMTKSTSRRRFSTSVRSAPSNGVARMGNRPFIVEDFKRALYPQLVMTTSWHRLSGLVVVDFRFLAALGMTGRREPVIAATPFSLPLPARTPDSPRRGQRPNYPSSPTTWLASARTRTPAERSPRALHRSAERSLGGLHSSPCQSLWTARHGRTYARHPHAYSQAGH